MGFKFGKEKREFRKVLGIYKNSKGFRDWKMKKIIIYIIIVSILVSES